MGETKEEQICELCRQNVQNDIKYGKFMTNGDISVHYYCLLLSSNLIQNGDESDGFLGFLPEDIVREAKRVKSQICHYCRGNYANVACCAPKCRRTFHLSCGIENGTISHFTDTYQTFCPRDVKWDKTEKPKKDEICLICYEKLGQFNKYFMILSPCCKTGWFHRWCLASFALSAGYFFKCPKCNDTNTFREEVVRKGIFIPDQDAAWEMESNAFADLLERPNECSSEKCNCPNGRKFDESDYKLILCQTCGSKAIHKKCMTKTCSTFICNECLQILKNRNLNIEQIVQENSNNSNSEDEDVDILNDADEKQSSNIEELNNVDTKKEEIRHLEVSENNTLKSVDLSSLENNSEEKINLCRNQQNTIPEKNTITDINNVDNDKDAASNRSSSRCSYASCESINNVLRLRQKNKRRLRRFSESSSSSTSSSSLPLRQRIFQIKASKESSYKDSDNEHETLNISNLKVNNDEQTEIKENSSTSIKYNKQTVQIKKKRCSSLGYMSEGSSSSTQNLTKSNNRKSNQRKSFTNVKQEKNKVENRKMKRRRSVVNDPNYCEYSDSTSGNSDENLLNLRRKLRKNRNVKNIPYELRKRSSNRTYDTYENFTGYPHLNKEWSILFSFKKKNNSNDKKKSHDNKIKKNILDVLGPKQTSIDQFFKTKTCT